MFSTTKYSALSILIILFLAGCSGTATAPETKKSSSVTGNTVTFRFDSGKESKYELDTVKFVHQEKSDSKSESMTLSLQGKKANGLPNLYIEFAIPRSAWIGKNPNVRTLPGLQLKPSAAASSNPLLLDPRTGDKLKGGKPILKIISLSGIDDGETIQGELNWKFDDREEFVGQLNGTL